ncbi:MAG: hypothetical protein ACKPKO_22855 [Candidatus Fonsibacter sp.]
MEATISNKLETTSCKTCSETTILQLVRYAVHFPQLPAQARDWATRALTFKVRYNPRVLVPPPSINHRKNIARQADINGMKRLPTQLAANKTKRRAKSTSSR